MGFIVHFLELKNVMCLQQEPRASNPGLAIDHGLLLGPPKSEMKDLGTRLSRGPGAVPDTPRKDSLCFPLGAVASLHVASRGGPPVPDTVSALLSCKVHSRALLPFHVVNPILESTEFSPRSP